MDTTQLMLTVTLSVTTILMVIIGIQLIFLLKDLRITIKKVNSIVVNLEKIGLSVNHGFGEVTGFISGFKTIFKIADILHTKKNGKTK